MGRCMAVVAGMNIRLFSMQIGSKAQLEGGQGSSFAVLRVASAGLFFPEKNRTTMAKMLFVKGSAQGVLRAEPQNTAQELQRLQLLSISAGPRQRAQSQEKSQLARRGGGMRRPRYMTSSRPGLVFMRLFRSCGKANSNSTWRQLCTPPAAS